MKGISLPAVLQVIDMERKSCSIEANSQGQDGQLHFSNGVLVHAATGALAGEEAAYEILSWRDPDYHVETVPFSGNPTLTSSVQHLLLETARRYDESQRPAQPDGGPGTNGNGGSIAADRAPAPSAGLESVTPESPAGHAPPETADSPAPLAAPSEHLTTGDLQAAIDAAVAALGSALLAADICLAVDGTPIVGHNSMPPACALFNQVAAQINRSLPRSGLPALGRYLLAELAEGQTVLLAAAGDYQLCVVVDTTQVQLGMLLNLVLPELLTTLQAGRQRGSAR